MDTGSAIFICAAYGVAWIIRNTDKFVGNFIILLISLGTLAVTIGGTNGEIMISAILVLISLGNLIYSVFASKK